MTLKLSTGLRTKMLDGSSLKAELALGKIKIFSGAAPATADAAETGTLLCTITVNATATGLTMAAAANGTISKNTDVWSGTIAVDGTAAYFRFVSATDDGTLSTTQSRVQGSIGTAGADMNLTSVNLLNGQVQALNYFSIALPTL